MQKCLCRQLESSYCIIADLRGIMLNINCNQKITSTISYQAKIRSFSPRAGPRSAVGSASDSRARGSGFNTRSGHILSFLLPLIQEGQLSVTGESMCTKHWLTA